MAILTATELTELRHRLARWALAIIWTKPQVNAAAQALENDWTTFLNRAASDIEAAAPGVFTAAHKRLILLTFLRQKVGREGGS